MLVTDKTDPDWQPIMSLAAAIVTRRGGRTCHAAIVSRELGLPAIVGTEHGTGTAGAISAVLIKTYWARATSAAQRAASTVLIQPSLADRSAAITRPKPTASPCSHCVYPV